MIRFNNKPLNEGFDIDEIGQFDFNKDIEVKKERVGKHSKLYDSLVRIKSKKINKFSDLDDDEVNDLVYVYRNHEDLDQDIEDLVNDNEFYDEFILPVIVMKFVEDCVLGSDGTDDWEEIIEQLQEIDSRDNNLYSVYTVDSKEDLHEIVKACINDIRSDMNLNWIDVSEIDDMDHMFFNLGFDGDVSLWDVSNVTTMRAMFFANPDFDCDLSEWDFSNVTDTKRMFELCSDEMISFWDEIKVEND